MIAAITTTVPHQITAFHITRVSRIKLHAQVVPREPETGKLEPVSYREVAVQPGGVRIMPIAGGYPLVAVVRKAMRV